ncbi:MAG: hypothetical protein WAN11_26035 [Syntrophobacteraceae bacterium]
MKIWRSLRRFLLWSGVAVTLLVLMLFLLLWWYSNSDCGHNTFTFSPKEGNFEAIADDECCDWGCRVTITLHRTRGWGLDTDVFIYKPTHADSPWTHDPVVAWLSANEMVVAVDRVGYIYSQKTGAHGVRITYRIGSVDEP